MTDPNTRCSRCEAREAEQVAAIRAEAEAQLVEQRMIGHGEGQRDAIADMNAVRIDDLVPRLEAREAERNALRAEVELLKACGAAKERLFPIQGGPAIPWSIVAPCEARAQRNHSQSLETLASRGGLSPGEACDLLMGRRWGTTPERTPAQVTAALEQMLEIVARMSNAQVAALRSALETLVAEWREDAKQECIDRDGGWVGADAKLRACADELESILWPETGR